MRASGATVSFLAASWLATGCGGPSTRDVRATVLEEDGTPVVGAVFYVEVADDDGPIAFVSQVTGTAGEVPPDAREAIHVPWRRGARIALAAFAPGFAPTVHRDPGVFTDGALLVMRPADEAGRWNPEVAELGFPFPGRERLAAAAGEPAHAALVRALRDAWSARSLLPEPLSDVEKRKISALEAMN